ncbi:MAG: class I SAM-dependent methyltransferase [Actinobacteria bacterium]|nr:class I SAM-dependent methyltransferase [Actinomycetota bacterium]
MHYTKGIFNIVKCDKCGLVYLNPRPKNEFIHEYYPNTYEPYNINSNDFYQKLNELFLSSYYKKNKNLSDCLISFLCQLIYHPIPKEYKGRILDVGCGNGIYLYNLEKYGWDVHGIEISPKAVAFAQEKLGLKSVRQGTIKDAKYPHEYFDVITMNHVIEHLPNPKEALREINRMLKNEGLLIITTPNINAFNAKIFREYWFPLETPRHLNLFQASSLDKLLQYTGFVSTKKAYDISTYHLIRSIDYWLNLNCNLLKKIKITFLPFTIILAILQASDVMTFYIRKKAKTTKTKFESSYSSPISTDEQ